MDEVIWLKCERCGHKWPQKGENKPKVCSSCKSLVWWKPLDPYWKHIREQNKTKDMEP